MTGQAAHSEGELSSLLVTIVTESVELFSKNEPSLRAELRGLVIGAVSRRGVAGAQEALEERLRECCQSHAGLDINGNDLLTPFARELLLGALSSVDWSSLAGKFVDEQLGRPIDQVFSSARESPDRREGD
jgi:hypothetical protein